MDFLYNPQIQIIFQLFLAAILGGIVGIEREYKRKAAGLRTYSLVALGSCLFTITAYLGFSVFSGQPSINFDPSRIILGIATGIGFIGAGVIFHKESHIEGLTTAAGLWTTAAIGVAVGIKLYLIATLASLITLVILAVLGVIEEKVFCKKENEKN